MVQAGNYRLRNAKSGTYLDESDKNLDTVHGWDSRPNNDNQKWVLEDAGNGNFRIRNLEHGRYLSTSGPHDNAAIKASSNDRDVWTLKDKGRGRYAIHLQGSNHVVDLDWGKSENGTRVSVWPFKEGSDQQLWQLEEQGGGSRGGYGQQPQQQQQQQQQQQWSNYGGDGQQQYQGAVPPGTYRIHNVFTGTAVDLQNNNANDGNPVIAWSAAGVPKQTWVFESGSLGYRVKNGATGSYLSYVNLNEGELPTGRGSPVEWTVTRTQEGYYQIHPAQNQGLVLDLAQGKREDGAKICLWSNNNNDNQKWKIDRA